MSQKNTGGASRLVVIGFFYKVSYMFRLHALNRKQCEILGNASLSHPGAWKFCQKVDEEPPPLTDAREGLKTFVAKSLRKKLGAQLLMRAACRTYMYTLSPRSKMQNRLYEIVIQVFTQTKCNYTEHV